MKFSKNKIKSKLIIFTILVSLVVFHLYSRSYFNFSGESTESESEEETKKFPSSISFSQEETALSNTVEQKSNNYKLLDKNNKILIWNTYWESRALWNKIFGEIIKGKCPVHNNCVFTMNRSEMNSSDAIIFHLVDLNKNYEVPKFRDPKQIWIAMTYEPPFILNHTGLNFNILNGVFNRTMSYRRDSDIVVRHGFYRKINPSEKYSNFISNWVNSKDDPKIRNYAYGKRRLVAWFASSRNCSSISGREHYIEQLQNYLDVDIYGSCGKYKCGVQKTLRNPYNVESDDCYFLLSIGYKFVLAFENSICKDYVTEKLYNNLKLNVVPVVFGGADYNYFAPPGSFIDATKLSPKELAEYLILLNQNDTLYNEFFNWKKDYYIDSNDGVPKVCDLCAKLNDPKWWKESQVYEKLDSWLTDKCAKGFVQGQKEALAYQSSWSQSFQ